MAAEHSREDGGEGQGTLFKTNRHDHDLQMYEGLDPYTCTGCKEMGVDFGYECSTPSCHSGKVSIFHVECATLEDEKQHPIRKDLTFRFRPKTLGHHRCTACDHELKGFVYETENHDMRLHPLCLMLPPEFVYEGHSFRLMMCNGDPYNCCCCNNINKHGWKYMCRDVCMAVGCVKDRRYKLSEIGIQSSPARRRRDHLKDVAKRVERYVVPAAGVAGGVAAVVSCFLIP